MFWKELGISGGTALVLLVVLYFVVKWAVRAAIDSSKNAIARAVRKGLEQYEKEKGQLGPTPGPEDGPV